MLKYCSEHTSAGLAFVCMSKDCFKPLCMKCIYNHCTEHEKAKTFPLIRTADEVREEISTRVGKTLDNLYSEADNIELMSGQILLKRIQSLHENVTNIVIDLIKEKEEKAVQKLKEVSGAYDNSDLKNTLQGKADHYEELNKQINNEDIHFLANLCQVDFDKELQKLLALVAKDKEPIRVSKSPNLETSITNFLKASIIINSQSGSPFVIKSDKKDADLEISPNIPMVIKKVGNTSTASICLGGGLNSGVNTFQVRIDYLHGNGWVGIGFIENPGINISVSNYSQAICICSDQSIYNLHVENKTTMQAGRVYTCTANFNTGDVTIASDDGMKCVAIGYKDKVLYPYFEFTSKHQITVISFKQEN